MAVIRFYNLLHRFFGIIPRNLIVFVVPLSSDRYCGLVRGLEGVSNELED